MKPNVLVLAHEPYLNGASHSLLTLLSGLKEEFNFLVIVPAVGAMTEALNKQGVEWKVCKLPRCAVSIRSTWQQIWGTLAFIKNKQNHLNRLKQCIGHFTPHLIYTNTSVQDLGFDLSRKIKCAHIWHVREYGDLDFSYQYIPSRKRILAKMRQSEAVVFTTHDLKKHWNLFHSDQFVVYNGVLNHTVAFQDVLTWQNPIRISIVGLIMPTKGQLDALEIVKALRDSGLAVQLQFFGEVNDAAYHEQLMAFVEKNQLQTRVGWKGYVAQDALYQQTDILLSCAKNEGFGRTIIEAMARGIPVIARAKGGPLEIIKSGMNGFLFTNTSEAVQRIRELIEAKHVRIQLSTQGRLHAQEQFSVAQYVHQMHAILKKINDEK